MAISDGIGQLASATGEALRNIRKASNMTTDRDLMRYNAYTDADFQRMEQEYGAENVLSYVREMETRKMMPVK